jgi:hypothetical protein
MTDPTPFERRLALALQREAGPRRPVDAVAIAAGARAAAPARRWPWLSRQTDSSRRVGRRSALRLGALVALLALAGGSLLLVGGSTSRPPAPWTPVPTLEGETIAPGVLLITDDGAGNDLMSVLPHGMEDVALAPDGGVWAAAGDRLFRLGSGEHWSIPRDLAVATDLTADHEGRLWATLGDEVGSFKDGAWTMAPPWPAATLAGRPAAPRAIEVTTDGRVWVSSGVAVAYLDGGSWIPAVDGDGLPIVGGRVARDLAATGDGGLWVRATETLLHLFDGVAWTSVAPPGVLEIGLIAAGPAGEVWVYDSAPAPPGCGGSDARRLARFDGEGWTVPQDRTPRIEHDMCYYGWMAVGLDRRLWAVADTWVFVYDSGPFWRAVVRANESPLQVAPDGSIWLHGSEGFIVIDGNAGT